MIDPLASYTFALRLQSHRPGSNKPIGLYKDTACTQPATLNGDAVMAWRDELGTSGLVLTAASTAAAATLIFVNGVPVVRGNGTSTLLSCAWTNALTNGAIQSVALRKSLLGISVNSYGVITRMSNLALGMQYEDNGAGNCVVAYPYQNPSYATPASPSLTEFNWHVYSSLANTSTTNLVRDGIALSSIGVNISRASAAGQTLNLFADGGGNFGDFDITGVLIYAATTNATADAATQVTIDGYQKSLLPPSTFTYQPGAILQGTATWEQTCIQEFKPVAYGGQFVATYTGGYSTCAIGLATSPDGATWTKQPTPVIGQGYGGESGNCCRSNLVLHPDGVTLVCYYANATNGSPQRRATSVDGGLTWTNNSTVIAVGTPVGTSGWTNSGCFISSGTWYFFCEAQVPAPLNYFICLCTSQDGITFTTPAPLTGVQLGTGTTGGPCLFRVGSRTYLTYHANYGPNSLPSDGYQAYSDDPNLVTWTIVKESILRRADDFLSIDAFTGNSTTPIDQIADLRLLQIGPRLWALFASQLCNATQKGEIVMATATNPFVDLDSIFVQPFYNTSSLTSQTTGDQSLIEASAAAAITSTPGILAGTQNFNNTGQTTAIPTSGGYPVDGEGRLIVSPTGLVALRQVTEIARNVSEKT